MNLQHLVVFASVGKHLSLTKAAADLHIGQPCITKQLKALERSIKTKLYLRKGRGIALTEKGKDLYLRANPILSQVEVLRQIFDGRAAVSNVGLLTVGGGFAPSSLLLPSVAVRLQKRHPGLEIYLRAARTHELEQVVLDGGVEFAVATSPAQSPELFSEPYRPEQLVFFARPDDPLTRRKHLKLADLASIRLVTRGRKDETGAVQQILRKIEAKGINLTFAMRCDTADGVKTYVRNGLGLGFLYMDHVRREIESGYFSRVKISGFSWFGQSYIIYPKERPPSPFAQEFLSLLRQARSENS